MPRMIDNGVSGNRSGAMVFYDVMCLPEGVGWYLRCSLMMYALLTLKAAVSR